MAGPLAINLKSMMKLRSWALLLLGSLSLSCASFQGPGHFRGPHHFFSPLASPPLLGEAPLFQWPVNQVTMSRGFQASRRPHYGLDLTGPRGTSIYAAAEGRVIYAGSGFSGYGRLVIVEHGAEWATFYAHLEKILVGEGQLLGPGQVLGTMGDSGRATGVHLHFEVRRDRQPLDPLSVLSPPTPPRSLSSTQGN